MERWVLLLLACMIHGYQSLTLTEMALEYTPNLDLHVIPNMATNDDMVPIAEGYYTSVFSNESSVTSSNSSRLSEQVQKLRNFLPSATPDMLTSGNNLIPVKTIIKVKTAEETLQILSQLGCSDLVLKDFIFPAIVVIWPDKIKEDQAELLLNSNRVMQACRGFNIASELIFAFGDDKDGLALFEVYNINSKHVVKKVKEGVAYFRCRNCRGVAIRRNSFHGLSMNVTATEDRELNDDLKIQKTTAGDVIFSPDGFSARILLILQQSLNFTVRAMVANNTGTTNNTWPRSMVDVAEGTANLGISITTMRPNHPKIISFLPPADESIISAFFRNPDFHSVRDIFARPFHVDLWAAVFSAWIVLAFFMILFTAIRRRYGLHLQSDQPEPDFARDSFIWSLATFCQQGWDEHPNAASLRTIFISGSFTGVVAFAGYSAAIVSTLSLRVDPIQSPQQLLKSSIKVGIHEGFISELLQQNTTNDIIRQLFQRKLKGRKESEMYLNITEGYKRMQKSSFAFINTRDNMYDYLKDTINDSDICLLKDIQILSHGFPMGHFMSKNSPYKEIIRYIYVSLREPGIGWKLRSNYTYSRRCLEASDSTGNALGVNDVFTAFMILVGGYILSLIFLAIEKLLRAGTTSTYLH